MATVKTTYLGNLRTEAEHLQSGSKIITDAPTDNRGHGEFFSPTDIFAASYASCALTIIGIATQTHGFNIDGTVVETTKVMGDNPRRIVELIQHFKFPHNNYSEKELRIIEGSIKACPVANSVSSEIKITRTMSFGG
ncbi:MAG: OsmC family protein [Bacteroidales bacterium]|nr:OsmC family protein [Bacteroidales bacterium]MCL2133480.1 OsmC family protein [Bacteroidales bacterium]